MPRATALVLAAAFTLSASALPARAGDATSFMQRFSGDWIGTGQLLFGAEPRPEFACELNGSTDGGK